MNEGLQNVAVYIKIIWFLKYMKELLNDIVNSLSSQHFVV